MANLNTKTISAGVGDILCVDGGISGDKEIKDGDGTGTNLYIDGTNLGIGKTAPTYPLHLYSAGQSEMVKIETANSAIQMGEDADLDNFFRFRLTAGDGVHFTPDNDGPILTLLSSNGHVGIGTATPGYNLDVYGAGQKSFGVRSTNNHCTLHIDAGTDGVTDDKLAYIYMGKIGGSNNGFIKYLNNATGADRTMEFGLNGTTPLAIAGEGRVGVNTSSPDTHLHVAGSFAVSGASESTVVFGNVDPTPSVANGNLCITGTATETIEGFDDGVVGQFLIIYSNGDITYSHDAGNLSCGQNDLVTTNGDVTMWIKYSSGWHLISWKDNSANLNSIFTT